jgi:hypothetical protein
MGAIWLKIIPGTITVENEMMRFWCSAGESSLPCNIGRHAFDELIQFYGLEWSSTSIDVLIEAIETIVNEKLSAGRLEQNGVLSIRPIDILRYGAAQAPSHHNGDIIGATQPQTFTS